MIENKPSACSKIISNKFLNCMNRPSKQSITKIDNKVFPRDLIFSSAKKSLVVENKHRQIVEGACKIFLKKGYHPTTTRDIAKACSMSIGQLYHYIRSKDDVLYLTHKHMQKVWSDYLKMSNLEQIDDPLRTLTQAIHNTIEFMVKNRKLIQFIYSESKYLNKEHLKLVLEMDHRNVIGFWLSLLAEVNDKERVKGDLDFLASLVAFMLVFLPLRGWTLRNKPIKKSLDSLQEFLLRGLGVK